MSINDLLGEQTPAPVPRLTPRAPLSVKELTALLIFGGLVWGAYDKMSHYAEKSSVEEIARAQTQMRLDMNHGFDTLGPKIDQVIKAQERADGEKQQQKHKP